MALIALDSIKPSAMDRNDRALHVDQIILAQLLSFLIKDCAIFRPGSAISSLEGADGLFHLTGKRCVITAFQ